MNAPGTHETTKLESLRPVIDKTYSFEDAQKAIEHLARGAFDKEVINVS